ncbi:zinc finger protein 786-like isoform X2 [Dasypus novemcinctus]|uniref:zinc finger protein 786-like isoform X2 n=2 Tax=Dasypus novemcinctus TaxID=9361 RepID=UPI00265E5589|nr:zinc finger protein 786-like isoform X2 [Dasypus novemcinctus]
MAYPARLLQDYGENGNSMSMCPCLHISCCKVDSLIRSNAVWNTMMLPLTFEDVAIYFTEEEWQNLEAWQKELYQHVMRTNYETLVSLDDGIPKPELIYWIEQGGNPFGNWEESQKSITVISSSADVHFDPGSQQALNTGEIKWHFQLDFPIQYSFGSLLDPKCSKIFFQKNHMQAHKCPNTRERSVTSPASNMALSEKSELSIVQSGQKLFQSPDCNESVLLKEDTEALQHNHLGERPFSCHECNKCFPTRSQLATHFRVHAGEKSFQCLKCNKSFCLSGLHMDEKPFQCPECYFTHPLRHTGKKPYSCNECGRGFTYHCKLRDHLRVHSGEKPFQCPECYKSFRLKGAVKVHQRIHSKERPFSCGECGKGFTSQYKLTEHFRVHTGEKPFPCLKCDKSFRVKAQLLSHQSLHTGERPFHCPECDKNFREKGHMVLHQRIHRPERPLYCGECGKGFFTKSKLNEHSRVHTKFRSAPNEHANKKRLSQLFAMIEADWS